MKQNSHPQKHTHLQAAQGDRTDQSLQKSVLFSSPRKLKNIKFPSLLKNITSQTHKPRQTDKNIHDRHLTALYLRALLVDTDDRRAATNSGFKKLAVQWLNQVQFFNQTSVQVDSSVLRNRQLLKPAKRYHQWQKRQNT